MKSWGMEIEFINTPLYCYKMLVCVHGRWSSKGQFHYHVVKDETFFVVRGKLELETRDTFRAEHFLFETVKNVSILHPQDTFRVFPTMHHRFRSVGKSCIFYEISTRHVDIDSIRVD
jgi:mannose-6-phosphate isomerase-like protein (cupin superfamily)